MVETAPRTFLPAFDQKRVLPHSHNGVDYIYSMLSNSFYWGGKSIQMAYYIVLGIILVDMGGFFYLR